jgi:hypothetical protein
VGNHKEYVLTRAKRFELRLKSGSGEVVSTAIKGLTLPIRAFFDAKAHRTALRSLLA